jgi:hypothetical protein
VRFEAGRVLTGIAFALLISTSATTGPRQPDTAEVAVRFVAGEVRFVVETAVSEPGEAIHAAIVATVAKTLVVPHELISWGRSAACVPAACSAAVEPT